MYQMSIKNEYVDQRPNHLYFIEAQNSVTMTLIGTLSQMGRETNLNLLF